MRSRTVHAWLLLPLLAGLLPAAPAAAQAAAGRGTRTAGIEALRQLCGEAIDRHCDDVQRGSGRLLRCLRSLEPDQRSEACQDYLDTLSLLREQMPPEAGAEE